MFPRFLAVLGALLLATAVSAAPKVDYNYHIRPILSDRCFLCHGPDEKARKAKLRLDVRESALKAGAIVPGKPEESDLIARITAEGHTRMPPKKSNLTLTKDEIALLRTWIAEGAEYKPHWAYLPLPRTIPVPGGKGRNALDRFIQARLEREGIKPAPPASREDWVRRVTFDLTGLPPTPAEVDAFLSDLSPLAFEKVADRLLASRRFGERMALEWIDAARYADSFGYQSDADSNVWPWRDWVIDAFNDNLPYDRFIQEQVAGDLLPDRSRKSRLATAFSRLHRMTGEGGSIAEEFRNEYVSDRVHTFGTVFLGLTLECSRCHDHKYDPFTQKDYYSLGAFFNSIDEWGTYDSAAFRPTPTLGLPTLQQETTIAELGEKLKVAEKKFATVRTERSKAVGAWLKEAGKKPDIPDLQGYYPLDAILPGNQLSNAADAKRPGSTSSANKIEAGRLGKALRFTGDDPASFPGVLGSVERWQPFTVSFWLRLPAIQPKAVIFQRMSGTDTGFHGTELTLQDGRLMLARIRFWPGNAIAVRTRERLPSKEWVHVAVSCDGSSKAAGLTIYLDGKQVASEVVRDNLTRDLQAGGTGLTFGEKFRSPGLKDGLLDDLRIHARALSPIEIAHLFDGKSLREALERGDPDALRDYYLGSIDAEMRKVREEVRAARQALFAAQTGVFDIMTMEEMPTPRQAFILRRGEYDAPKDRPVGRDTPASLPAFPSSEPRNRLGLARWLTLPDHPLTARVAVNRTWQMFFGTGFVRTTENFGVQGALPTYPELLDWLARDFISSGWDMKRLCRQVVLSDTYRQRSSSSPELRQRDPDNLFLARGPSRRLTAEMLRDQALAVSGLLSGRIGGPPVKPYQPAGMWRAQNAFLPEYVQDKGEGLYRRSMYTFWRRTSPPPGMLALDVPTREVCTVKRQPTSTPLQPLVLLNDPQFVEAARVLGERMLREGGKSPEEQVTFAFRLAATRKPNEREITLLVRLLHAQAELFRTEPERAKKLLAIGERPYAKDLEPANLAAASVVASTILNLDAALMAR